MAWTVHILVGGIAGFLLMALLVAFLPVGNLGGWICLVGAAIGIGYIRRQRAALTMGNADPATRRC